MSPPPENFFDSHSPVALVFGGSSLIGSRLCEEFLEKKIRVISVNDFDNNSKENTSNLKNNPQIALVDVGNLEVFFENVERLNYIVDVCGVDSNNTRFLLKLVDRFGSRYLYISTFLDEESAYDFIHTPEQEKKFVQILDEEFSKQKINFRIIHLGDIYGPRMVFENNPLSQLIKEYITSEKLKVPREEVYFYPLFVDDAVWGIVKSLLSPGTKGSTISLSGDKSTLSTITETIKSLNGSVSIEYTNQNKYPNRQKLLGRGILREGRELVNWEAHTTLTEGLASTLEWFKKNKSKIATTKELEPSPYVGFWQNSLPKEKEKDTPGVKAKNNKKTERKVNLTVLFVLLIFLLWFFAFPFIELFFGLVNLQVAQNKVRKKDLHRAETWANISSFWFKNSQESFLRWSFFPPLKAASTTMAQKGRVLDRIIDIVKEKRSIRESTNSLFEKVLGEDSYSIAPLASLLSVQNSSLGQSLAFLATEIQDNKDLSDLVTKRLGDSNSQLSDLRGRARTISDLAANLGGILGYKTRKSYLILIQDNTQTRPGGGVVLGYGILTFDKGRLISGEFFKTSVADGQLKGKVSPPQPLAKYASQQNWMLRDVFWDQDFSLVAKRAIWFADKELDQKIDGVISVDLDFLEDLIKEAGPVVVGGVSVDSKSLYKLVLGKNNEEKQQVVVDIFNQLYDSLTRNPSKVGDLLGVASLENLDQKHIMLFVNDAQIQNILTEGKWGGSTKHAACSGGDPCFSDYLNFADSNMGEGSTSYYLKRYFSLDVFVQNGRTLRKLT